MGFIRLFRNRIKEAFKIGLDRIIKLLPVYYKSINKLPVFYWFELQKGDLSALYKIKLTKRIPYFFNQIALDMMFEFDYLDLTVLREKANMTVLYSQAARTGNKSKKFEADTINKRLTDKLNKPKKDITLNEFINYIEMTFNNIGQLDVYKLSTSRAFSLYHNAIEKNKELERIYNKKAS